MGEREVTAELGLELRSFSVEPWPGKVRGFASAVKAVEHLCDHLLTRPEREPWALWLPTLSDLLEGGDRAVFRFARALWREDASRAQPLYDEWMAFLGTQCRAAVELGWIRINSGCYGKQERPVRRDFEFLGPSGALVIVSERGILRTAYFPLPTVPREIGVGTSTGGSSADEPTEEARISARRRNPLPREGARSEAPSPREGPRGRARGARPSSHGDDPLLERFAFFRRCAANVRSRWSGSSSAMVGGPAPTALEVLRRARRKFDSWRQLLKT